MRSRVLRSSLATILFSSGLCLIASVLSTAAAEKPAASGSPATNAPRSSLPPPFSESLFTFLEIEQQKEKLKERIVRVEISKVLGEGEDSGNNLLRFIAKDNSKSASPYGQVAFPRDGLEKTGLQREGKGPLAVYFRVHVVSPKAAAICEAVGTKFSSGAQGAHYDW